MRWEYRIIKLHGYGAADEVGEIMPHVLPDKLTLENIWNIQTLGKFSEIATILGKLGAEGWEMTGIHSEESGHGRIFFKRPKP